MATRHSDSGRHHRTAGNPWLFALPLGAIALTAAAGMARRSARIAAHPADSAPGRTAKRWTRFGDYAVVGRTVTINRPRAQLYAFWRDFKNLPGFMENIAEVRPESGKRSTWIIPGPGGRTYAIRTDIISERENEHIAWRSVEGSDLDTEGKVSFRDAPAGRGTEVEAIIAYKPPAGRAGQLVAKILQREPAIQARRDLKRLKMLMETGEIATAENRRSAATR
jgi:uncharacterized membrane protein